MVDLLILSIPKREVDDLTSIGSLTARRDALARSWDRIRAVPGSIVRVGPIADDDPELLSLNPMSW